MSAVMVRRESVAITAAQAAVTTYEEMLNAYARVVEDRLELLATKPRVAALRDMGAMVGRAEWSWPSR